MKKLFIMRHADASFNSDTDFNRKLSLKGIGEAELTAINLAKDCDNINFCYCSEATRTIETLNIISKQIKIDQIKISKELYETTKDVLLNHIEIIENKYKSAIIIAHNPSVSYLLKYLTGSDFYFSTSNIVEIQFELDSWKHISNLTGTVTNIYI